MITEINGVGFGEPVPVHNRDYLDYLGVFVCPAQHYYLPPIQLSGLAKMWKVNTHHGSCLEFRHNEMKNAFVSSDLLPIDEFSNAEADRIHLGNAYLQKIYSRGGKLIRLKHIPGINVRRRPDKPGRPRQYCYLENGSTIDLKPGEVQHIYKYEPLQGIYGLPDWTPAISSCFLNEDATLFRRKYYRNGSHLGYIMVTNGTDIPDEVVAELKKAIESGKGVGNFKTMYLHAPGADKDAVQLIPVGDMSRKDEFERVKNVTAADIMVAHRMPPGLAGIIPGGDNGNIGDPLKALKAYRLSELPAQTTIWTALNRILPTNNQIRFDINLNTDGTNG